MRFENAFEVAGRPAQVIGLFEDVRLMASFLPGATVGEAHPDGSHPATLVVAFGPKRLAFKGALTSRVDRANLTGEVEGRASADVRGAKMFVAMNYRLAESPAGTRVVLVSEAELTGMLAEFASGGGVIVTQALLDEFAKNLSAHVRRSHPDAPGVAATSAPTDSAPQPLSALSLLLGSLKAALRMLRARFRA